MSKTKKIHVYAIIRVDYFYDSFDEECFVVTKIVFSDERAKQEVDRLNLLNKEKRCKYFFQLTRLELIDDFSEKPEETGNSYLVKGE